MKYLDKIKAILKISGLTQSALASEIGVTFLSLNRWLNQQILPRAIYLERIDKLYKQYVGVEAVDLEKLKHLKQQVGKTKFKDIRKQILENRGLYEDILIRLTYNSNAIEGSTLSLKETGLIIFEKTIIKDRSLIEHLEAINHARVLKDILANNYSGSISEQMIKDMHFDLMQNIREDAGAYSQHQRIIKGVDLALPHPDDIPEEMARLIVGYQQNKKKLDSISLFTKFHADFEAIHPFGDGNGRIGRLLLIKQLLDENYPPALIEKTRKYDYYDALEYAQKYKYEHLELFLCEEILVSYNILAPFKHL